MPCQFHTVASRSMMYLGSRCATHQNSPSPPSTPKEPPQPLPPTSLTALTLLLIPSSLFRIRQALLIAQLRIPQAARKRNQRHTQTQPRDAQQPLNVPIRFDGSISLRSARRVDENLVERTGVPEIGLGGVIEALGEFFGDGLRPDRAGDGIAEGGADVVGCEVEGCNYGDVWGLLVTVKWKASEGE